VLINFRILLKKKKNPGHQRVEIGDFICIKTELIYGHKNWLVMECNKKKQKQKQAGSHQNIKHLHSKGNNQQSKETA
jgi:hypothetical protein